MKIIARIYNGFESKFGVPRQSGIADTVSSEIVFEKAYRNPDAVRIKSKIDVVEPMGAETFLYLDKGFISRIDPHRSCKQGEEIELAMDQTKAHLFDAESGMRII